MAITRLIFTGFSALLVSAFIAPVANASTHTSSPRSEGALPTMRTLNQYNPRDDASNWQPNNAHTNPGQANTVRTDTTEVDTTVGQTGTPDTNQPGMNQPGGQPGMNQPGMNQPGTQQPGTQQPGMNQPGTTQPGTQQPGMTQPDTTQPDAVRPGDRQQQLGLQRGESLPTMRVLNQYNPRDHERDWQPNSPEHDIASDRRTIEEAQFGSQIADVERTNDRTF